MGRNRVRKRPAAAAPHVMLKKPSAAGSGHGGRPSMTYITPEDIRKENVPHFYDIALNGMDLSGIRLAIPSFGRPDMLCQGTLPLLRRHGFPLEQVHVFISPVQAPNCQEPEWYRYLSSLRREGFGMVNLQLGRDGLEHQMHAIFQWAQNGYVLVMTDDVKDVLERKMTMPGNTPTLSPLPLGMLCALFLHGRDLLNVTDSFAWSVNCSQNVRSMNETAISRRFGLLEGNLTGFRLEGSADDWRVEEGLGIVYDVALSCNLWSTGRLFCRYRSLCISHRYRGEGGYQTVMQRQSRRREEDGAITRLARRHPTLIEFLHKPASSVRTMQYRMLPHGENPFEMKAPKPATCGRRREAFAARAMTSTERVRLYRHGKRSLSAA